MPSSRAQVAIRARSERPSPSPGARNPITPLDLDWILAARVNESAVARRVAELIRRRPVAPPQHIAWLTHAIRCIDLTTLAGDDTPGRVRQLAAQARYPVGNDVLERLGVSASPLTVASLCVYHNLVAPAVEALAGSGIPVCAVSTGFPAGQTPRAARLAEIAASLAAGAAEIDVVIHRTLVLTGDWPALYDEVTAFRAACGEATLKVILAAGDLADLRQVARAARVCLLAGADFIKTSTGKEVVNATLPIGLAMVRAIRDHATRTGHRVGFKPAGGIRTTGDVLRWMVLVKEELGDRWLGPDRFRIGASGVLDDVVAALTRRVHWQRCDQIAGRAERGRW